MSAALVILAAGMGSRYGGPKQIDPIDEDGHLIIDFSIYDAIKAGFDEIVFIIKREMEKDVKEIIGNRIEKYAKIKYVFQEIDALPEGYAKPEGRTKPWGTAHALYACKGMLTKPFAIINADDYYGRESYKMLYDYLTNVDAASKEYAMAGYVLEKTLTDHGSVARGVCEIENGYLVKIDERTQIEKKPNGAAYSEDGGETWTDVSLNAIVSMNMWGFTCGIFEDIEGQFADFWENSVISNPMKAEFLLPGVVGNGLKDGSSVKVLTSDDTWFGVTYREDKPLVMEMIKKLKEDGVYPQKLWEDNNA